MEQRRIELTLFSAQDLKNVKLSGGPMNPYAVAWIHPAVKLSTPQHSHGGVSPCWNSVLTLACDDNAFRNAHITVEIYHHGSFSNTLVGTARVPLADFNAQRQAALGSHGAHDRSLKTYQVRRPSGKVQGGLNVAVKVGTVEKQAEAQPWTAAGSSRMGVSEGDESRGSRPVTAYPAAAAVPYPVAGASQAAAPSGYPPQAQAQVQNQQTYYPTPPLPYPAGYAAAAQPGPVPYFQQQAPYPAPYPAYAPPPPRRSGLGGAGFGTGLLGGALGGVLLGSALDGGDGFGDGGGGGCGGGCGGF